METPFDVDAWQAQPGNNLSPERMKYGIDFLLNVSLSVQRMVESWPLGVTDLDIANVALVLSRHLAQFAEVTARESVIAKFAQGLDFELDALLGKQTEL